MDRDGADNERWVARLVIEALSYWALVGEQAADPLDDIAEVALDRQATLRVQLRGGEVLTFTVQTLPEE